MKNIILSALLLCVPFVIGGCSGAKESLGLAKKAPDEFSVVRRAPLSMPPDYTLRPPTPGATRPQEQDVVDAARTEIFGTQTRQVSDTISQSDTVFLTQAGAQIADPDIRVKIEAEKDVKSKDKRPIGQRLFGIGSDDNGATVVDAKAEAARIIENKENGEPVDLGETPMR